MPKKLKMVFVSDIHIAPNQDWSNCIWKYTPNEEIFGLLDSFVEIVKNEIKPDVVIELGDRIIDVDSDTDMENHTLIRELVDERVGCPCFHVDGNHDFINTNKAALAEVFNHPMLPYSEEFKGFKLVFLDSLDPMLSGVGGRVSEEQLKWIEKAMNEDGLPKLVFSHHPLNYHEIHRNFLIPEETVPLMSVQNRDEVRQILENGKHFIMHGAGHHHFWANRVSEKGTYVVNPSLSAAHPARTNAPGLFTEALVDDEGFVETVVHSINPRRVVGCFTNR